jgi:hypothetical protein
MGKRERETRKAAREALMPYRRRLYRAAGALFAQGEGSWAKALRLALAAGLADEAALGLLVGDLDRKGVEAACQDAEEVLSLLPPLKERRAPPEGWGPMREVLAELRLEGLAQSSDEGSITPLFLLATELAHFAPLHRAALARALYELYGKTEPGKLLALYQALAHRASEVERNDPLLSRLLGGGKGRGAERASR